MKNLTEQEWKDCWIFFNAKPFRRSNNSIVITIPHGYAKQMGLKNGNHILDVKIRENYDKA